jgi:hypothetical protein
MLRMIIKVAFLLVLLSGCAAGKLVGNPPIIENDNFATVHIARPFGYAGCGVRATITIDRSDFYWLACGEYISFRISANKDITISQTTSPIPDDIDIDPQKEKQYYLVYECGLWSCGLHQQNKFRFTDVASKCDKIIKVGY